MMHVEPPARTIGTDEPRGLGLRVLEHGAIVLIAVAMLAGSCIGNAVDRHAGHRSAPLSAARSIAW
jgi:hypothetical protein